jgi:SNF2 family DNA or RNA helicase
MESDIVNERDEKDFSSNNEFNIQIKKPFELKPHQIKAIKWMINNESCPHRGIRGGILSMEMGLGKTLSSLVLTMIDKRDIDNKMPDLVVCSKTVLYEWKNNIDKFFGSDCRYLVFHKSFLKEYNEMNIITFKQYDIVLTTYDVVANTAKKEKIANRDKDYRLKRKHISSSHGPSLLFKIHWNRIIADESHTFSNPTSLRFYSMLCLRSSKRWGLTGTPIRNYSSDLFSQLVYLGFSDSNAQLAPKKFNYRVYEKYELNKCVLFQSYESEHVTLPSSESNNEILEFDNNESDMYSEQNIYDYFSGVMKNVYRLFVQKTVSFSCVLELFLRLRQICISPSLLVSEKSKPSGIMKKILKSVPIEMKNRIDTFDLSVKISKIVLKIKSVPPNEKIIVFSFFKKTFQLIEKGLEGTKKCITISGDVVSRERESAIDLFKNSNDHNLLFLTYKSGSEGLNLTIANHVILSEPWWCNAVMEQAVARIYRLGQINNIHVHTFIMKNSIEERIVEICKSKKELVKSFSQPTLNKKVKIDSNTLGYIIGVRAKI